ncbi:hypothetical protein INS49_003003 [Diaporthe citri]|uniref:uncharacterized protein n=1 Tax=Diaporthe citri TaxID=83186 RepID=UPI001C805201|nr:uncharacterized protein INS49_003003 [Diaporthe citri]KAG6368789.1 hypothetical protein INS49_003003 [Diaporthe citri]
MLNCLWNLVLRQLLIANASILELATSSSTRAWDNPCLRWTAAGWAEEPKVAYVSAIGVGKSSPNTHWVLRTLIGHSSVELTHEDHEAAEAELREVEAGKVVASGEGDGGYDGEYL